MSDVHIAQINIGVMIAPTDDPAVAEFMDNLDRINAQADTAEGFVWRLQTESGNATEIQIFPNPLQLVNMSVWESVETLKSYVYRSEHVEFFRRRAAWFEADAKQVALWSTTAGQIPELDEAVRRVEFLECHGPSPYAFGFVRPPASLLFESTPDGSDRTVVSALYDGNIVGRGVLRQIEPTTGEFTDVNVEPSVRGLLVSEALMDQLALTASRLGLTEQMKTTDA